MSRRTALQQEFKLVGTTHAKNQLDFSTLYDRYAPVLLGFILKNGSNEAEATTLLEVSFTKIQAQMAQFRPEQQPLFAWLLAITRHTVLEALHERKSLSTSVLQLSTSGKVISFPTGDAVSLIRFGADAIASQRKALFDAVLFKNCTPEEAADSIGLPVESARQQLRLALQQLRMTPIN